MVVMVPNPTPVTTKITTADIITTTGSKLISRWGIIVSWHVLLLFPEFFIFRVVWW
jgi:hypothetical protein